jgi:hypothetical protein
MLPARVCRSRTNFPRHATESAGQAPYLIVEALNVYQEIETMLWTIFVILLVLWLIGLVSFQAIGAYIHILLVLAVVVLLIQLITGRRAAL